MPSTDAISLDVGAALGAATETSVQELMLYIPDRDRVGREIGTQRRWVLEGAALLTEIGGGVTILPAMEGGWLDPETGAVVWERPVKLYTFVRAQSLIAALPRLRSFLHRLGAETEQGEVVAEFDGTMFHITEFEVSR